MLTCAHSHIFHMNLQQHEMKQAEHCTPVELDNAASLDKHFKVEGVLSAILFLAEEGLGHDVVQIWGLQVVVRSDYKIGKLT